MMIYRVQGDGESPLLEGFPVDAESVVASRVTKYAFSQSPLHFFTLSAIASVFCESRSVCRALIQECTESRVRAGII